MGAVKDHPVHPARGALVAPSAAVTVHPLALLPPVEAGKSVPAEGILSALALLPVVGGNHPVGLEVHPVVAGNPAVQHPLPEGPPELAVLSAEVDIFPHSRTHVLVREVHHTAVVAAADPTVLEAVVNVCHREHLHHGVDKLECLVPMEMSIEEALRSFEEDILVDSVVVAIVVGFGVVAAARMGTLCMMIVPALVQGVNQRWLWHVPKGQHSFQK